ncbi:hypothetical protein Pcinc_040803 [Petrolisthes cinctipes]|uniref:Uncharacterized protein n=1 Tax=Petrolisthes cinctipes TaxID=88211 RepID=A0AAE1BLH6_PETCI|nr:hypothetical protein Pcinc_040803 [Petrolisthes cinctipes]
MTQLVCSSPSSCSEHTTLWPLTTTAASGEMAVSNERAKTGVGTDHEGRKEKEREKEMIEDAAAESAIKQAKDHFSDTAISECHSPKEAKMRCSGVVAVIYIFPLLLYTANLRGDGGARCVQ